MRKLIFFLIMLFLVSEMTSAQQKSSDAAHLNWWEEARFGMFIH